MSKLVRVSCIVTGLVLLSALLLNAPMASAGGGFTANFIANGENDAILPSTNTLRAGQIVGGNNPNGPGVYDVIVVALDTPDGVSPATQVAVQAEIAALDNLYNRSTFGQYRFRLRARLTATSPSAVCDSTLKGVLEKSDQTINSVVSEYTGGTLNPTAGAVGTLVVSVVQEQTLNKVPCNSFAGVAWVGRMSTLINGVFGSSTVSQVLSHETGHTLGLHHANAMLCSGVNEGTNLAQPVTLAWPCSIFQYGDPTDTMGSDAWRHGLGNFSAAHLTMLGVLPQSAIANQWSGSSTTYTVKPLYANTSGTKVVFVKANGTKQWSIEYRPSVGADSSEGAIGAGGVHIRWVSPIAGEYGDAHAISAGMPNSTPRIGFPAGADVDILGQAHIKVISETATEAVILVTTPAAQLPSAPLNTTAWVGNDVGSVQVNWSAPEKDGGLPITSYVARASLGGGSCSTSGTSCTITGLTRGQSYTFTVQAVTSLGAGAASSAVGPITIAVQQPSRPLNVKAVAGEGQITVSWQAPADDGGSNITKYLVTDINGHECSTTGALTCTVAPLLPGYGYSFAVIATNARGPSQWSEFTPITVVPNLEKTNQTVKGTVPSSVRVGKRAALPKITWQGRKISWVSKTPRVCSILTNKAVVGVRKGACTIVGWAAGSTSLNSMTGSYRVKVVKK